MNNDEWKFWRAVFNPGFSATHMLALVPGIVDSVEVFCGLLHERVGKGIFSLDTMTTSLTMEIITKTTLDTDLKNERSEHALPRALNTILNWHSFWDPRILLNPLRPLVQWYYSKMMYTLIRLEVNKRFEEVKLQNGLSEVTPHKRGKSVLALALESYISQQDREPASEGNTNAMHLDEDFAQIAVNQIRLFIMAGNDSTSITIVYCYHLLSKSAYTLSELRKEHDAICGPSENAAARLKAYPTLLSQCKYTIAVIKETLRLYPPASSLRQGRQAAIITDKNNTIYPTEGLGAMIMHHFIHRNPRVWVRPDEFLPERWLVESGHELYPPTHLGAYRPFEMGLRNCIGQILVFHEICVTLILTVRTLDIAPAYDEWDAMQFRNGGAFSKLSRR